MLCAGVSEVLLVGAAQVLLRDRTLAGWGWLLAICSGVVLLLALLRRLPFAAEDDFLAKLASIRVGTVLRARPAPTLVVDVSERFGPLN